ncbi:MAG: hypothetical protein OEW15_09805 [Nitrospirota bacterium]|nr:hypothetical protein [Nitrospirota bacterium]
MRPQLHGISGHDAGGTGCSRPVRNESRLPVERQIDFPALFCYFMRGDDTGTVRSDHRYHLVFLLKGVLMAGIIIRKPVVGFASGTIIGLLGLLLVQMDSAPAAATGIVRWMFKIAGWFMLFVGAGSYVTALYGIWQGRNRRSQNN